MTGLDGSAAVGARERVVATAVHAVADLVADGAEVGLIHGNGPQVGTSCAAAGPSAGGRMGPTVEAVVRPAGRGGRRGVTTLDRSSAAVAGTDTGDSRDRSAAGQT